MANGRVLVTGAAGSLGRYLCEGWPDRDASVIPLARGPLGDALVADLTRPADVMRAVDVARPSVVVHAAALTDIDHCQRDAAAAFRTNVEATRNLCDALAASAPTAKLVYISTDQMYSGPGPSREDAQAAPASVYALTKLWGEEIALSRPGALVVRLNYVGRGTPARQGLAGWLVSTLRAGKPVTLFTDVLFNPAFGGDVPGLLRGLVVADALGRVNLGSRGGQSKAEFLVALARRLNLPTASVKLGSSGDVALSAPRSTDTRMECVRAETLLGQKLPDMAQVVESVAREFERAKIDE
jgi:dTDP-4-dehydrorhamnose reductase